MPLNLAYIKSLLPYGAELLKPQSNYKISPIVFGDIDGDRTLEMAVAYRVKGEPYITIFKKHEDNWHRFVDIKGLGYNISYLGFGEITNYRKKDLIVGWQVGGIWSELNIYSWIGDKIKKCISGVSYSDIKALRVCDRHKENCRIDLALWTHVTGNAYEIEVVRWNGSKLVPDKKVYPFYFKTVVEYYKKQIKKMPDAAFHWYYLADAQIKALMKEEALKSIKKGMSLGMKYPSKEEFLKLKEKAENISKFRIVKALYPASVNTVEGIKWGFINSTGDFVVNPIYDYARDFEDNGLAMVTLKDKSGLINEGGKYIVKPQYDNIGGFNEGIAIAYENNGNSVALDEKGNVIFKSNNFIGNFQEGRAVFTESLGDKLLYGYIDKKGNKVIPAKFISANSFKEGKAIVQLEENKYGIIELNGKVIKTFDYPYVGPEISEGLLAFKETIDGDFGFIDEQGNIIIKPQFSGVGSFKEGRSVVNASKDYSNKYGLIDKKGKFIINPAYNDIQQLGEGMLSVGVALNKDNQQMGSKYAIADNNGKFLTEFIYYNVMEYKNGIASAYNDTGSFFIDKTGRREMNLPIIKGYGSLFLEGNIIRAIVDNRTSYYTKDGKIVWEQNTKIPLNKQYTVIENKYSPNRNYLVYYPQIEGMEDKSLQQNINSKLKTLSNAENIDPNKVLDYSYNGNFEITFFKKNLLEINLNGYNYPFGAAHGMPSKIYTPIDLVKGKVYELKDLFKASSDYVKVLSDIVRKQIEAMGPDSYIWIDSYKGITANQPFFIDEKSLNLYFLPYEIAPYAAGFPTFRIPFIQIMNIVDVNGDFWSSFN